MEIKKENVVNAYMAGDNSVKEMLRVMFPDIEFKAEKQPEKRPVTERVKTFEDACRELGEDNALVLHYRKLIKENEEKDISMTDIVAFLKLRIICAALNEGWEPQFAEKDDNRWYPLHFLWTDEDLAHLDEEWKRSHALIDTYDYSHEGYAGFAFANSFYAPSNTYAGIGSRICLKSEALSNYCGTQFIRLWADFKLCHR